MHVPKSQALECNVFHKYYDEHVVLLYKIPYLGFHYDTITTSCTQLNK